MPANNNSVQEPTGIDIEIKKSLEKIKKDFINWYDSINITVKATAGIITAFLLPAIMQVGTEAVISGGKMAVNFIINITKIGIEAAITATKGLALLITNLVLFGIEGWKSIAVVAAWIAKNIILIASMATQAITTGVLTAATWLLNAAIAVLTSPITLVVLAIGALIAIGVLLYKNWDKIKEVGDDTWNFIEKKIKGVSETIGNLIKSAKNWGKDFIDNIVDGIRGGINKVKEAGGAVGSALEKFLGFSDPPEEGPLHTAGTWGSHLVDTYANGIDSNLSVLQSAINKLQGVTIPNNTGTISASMASNYDTASISNDKSSPGTTINKNYYIQPGQMIATRGEIRNFARLLSEYDTFESGR